MSGLTREVEIPEDLMEIAKRDYEVTWLTKIIKIKRFTYGDQLAIQQEAMKVKANSISGVNADINVADLQALSLVKGVLAAPWQINDLNAVKALPPMIAEWLRGELDEFNTISVKKKES
jgi:hypothetical protein